MADGRLNRLLHAVVRTGNTLLHAVDPSSLCLPLDAMMSLGGTVLSPMILARTRNNGPILETVQILFGTSLLGSVARNLLI